MKLFFTSEEQEVRKSNARADRKFLLEVAFFHWRKHKNFSPIGFLKKMEIANAPEDKYVLPARENHDYHRCKMNFKDNIYSCSSLKMPD